MTGTHEALKLDELLKFVSQIASGMAHLESEAIVHGDLAAFVIVLDVWSGPLT